MTMRERDTTHPSRRAERGVSIIEVIITAFVLTLVVIGATAVFSSSSSATSKARVRDKQTALANEVMAKLQADASWALECRRQQDPFDPANPECNLTQWLQGQPQLQSLAIVRESSGEQYRFSIGVTATGIDLAADGVRADDTDGLLPDVYRLRVTIAPTADLDRRVGGMKPVTLQQEVNPTLRVQTGRVTVNACLVLNQVDERMPAGTCDGSANLSDMQPPGALDTSSAAAMRSTCQHPENSGGSDRRDCHPYRCATRVVALTDPARCATQAGWNMNVLSHPDLEEFTGVQIKPASGTVTLRSVSGGTTWTKQLIGGTAQFTELPVGQYRVQFNPPGYQPWKSKSVPSSGEVSVEAGLNSRAVLMYRPVGTATVRFQIESRDVSGPPWLHTTIPGFPRMLPSGEIVDGGVQRFYLVPVPQGRLLGDDRPYADVPRNSSTTEMVFTNVEPGLYSFQLGNEQYDRFEGVTNTAGFIYVYPDGRVYYGEATEPPLFIETMCAQDIRAQWVAGGPIVNPITGTIWEPQPCSSPSGPAPPSGGGGGGAS